MRPLVLASWELDSPSWSSSPRIFFASDLPSSTPHWSKLLVVHDQGTKSSGGNLVSQDGGGGTVAQESLVGDELLGSTLSLDFVWALADHEGLSLCEEVGRKHPVYVSPVSQCSS
jgi:hypothetical protein